MNIYTQNFSVCNSGQYICVTGLCNVFFAFQDLIDRIHSYFQGIVIFILIIFFSEEKKCIQNVSQILTNFCIHFVYKIKRTMKVKLCISLSKCRIHFVYVLYTSILVYEKCTLYKLCIQFVCKMHPTYHHI